MPDPFETLRLPDAPLAPRQEFAADLRRRLVATADRSDTKEQPMANPTTIHRVETYLSVAAPRAAIEFYQRAFGATVLGEPLVMADGSIGHSELAIGDSVIRVAGEHPPEAVHHPGRLGGTTVQLYVTVDDADAVVARAAEAGGEVLRPVAEAHGTRMGKLRDPFGHNWFVVTEAVVAKPAGSLGYFTLGLPDGRRARAFWSSLFAWDLDEGPEGYHIANIGPVGSTPATAPPSSPCSSEWTTSKPWLNGSESLVARLVTSASTPRAETSSAPMTRALPSSCGRQPPATEPPLSCSPSNRYVSLPCRCRRRPNRTTTAWTRSGWVARSSPPSPTTTTSGPWSTRAPSSLLSMRTQSPARRSTGESGWLVWWWPFAPRPPPWSKSCSSTPGFARPPRAWLATSASLMTRTT